MCTSLTLLLKNSTCYPPPPQKKKNTRTQQSPLSLQGKKLDKAYFVACVNCIQPFSFLLFLFTKTKYVSPSIWKSCSKPQYFSNCPFALIITGLLLFLAPPPSKTGTKTDLRPSWYSTIIGLHKKQLTFPQCQANWIKAQYFSSVCVCSFLSFGNTK